LFGGNAVRLQAIDDMGFAWLMGEGAAPADAPSLPEGGIAPDAVMGLLRGLAASVGSVLDGEVAWLMIVGGEAVGLISITKVADPERPEIGFGVAPARQRRGHATAAVVALIELARPRFAGFIAESAVDNAGSKAALSRVGFTVHAERVDPEDGPVLCWALEFAR